MAFGAASPVRRPAFFNDQVYAQHATCDAPRISGGTRVQESTQKESRGKRPHVVWLLLARADVTERGVMSHNTGGCEGLWAWKPLGLCGKLRILGYINTYQPGALNQGPCPTKLADCT